MKIAIVSDEGKTVSQHFGRASMYVVVTVEDGKVVSQEQRAKMGHVHFANEPHTHESHDSTSKGHGFDAASQSKHQQMASAITDCQVLLARGMGAGAYQSLQTANIQPRITDIANIDDAVRAFLDGTLVDHTEKLH